MMDYTNQHQRTLMRLLTRHTTLYTEMVVCNTLLHRQDPQRSLPSLTHSLTHSSPQHPIVAQLGGADPSAMHAATRLAKSLGYSEVNINVGCPSERVAGAGCFGAVLMRTPQLVGDLALAASLALGVAPTIKCRIGVDDLESYSHLYEFIDHVSTSGGVTHFIIHARKAILGANFSPKQNRTVPPLHYSYVYDLVRDFPHLRFTLNGGVSSMEEVQHHLSECGGLAGVMVGRAAVSDPFEWRHADTLLFGAARDPGFTRYDILCKYAEYAREVEELEGPRCRHTLVKPLHGLFNRVRNGKKFRYSLGENVKDKSMGMFDVIMKATESVGHAELLHT
jgi:tRNA-dihydrouridine synthase A